MTALSAHNVRTARRVACALRGFGALAAYVYLSRILEQQQPRITPAPNLAGVCQPIGDLVGDVNAAVEMLRTSLARPTMHTPSMAHTPSMPSYPPNQNSTHEVAALSLRW